jgi:hypothetical protein
MRQYAPPHCAGAFRSLPGSLRGGQIVSKVFQAQRHPGSVAQGGSLTRPITRMRKDTFNYFLGKMSFK